MLCARQAIEAVKKSLAGCAMSAAVGGKGATPSMAGSAKAAVARASHTGQPPPGIFFSTGLPLASKLICFNPDGVQMTMKS